jgi:hypothetical protein
VTGPGILRSADKKERERKKTIKISDFTVEFDCQRNWLQHVCGIEINTVRKQRPETSHSETAILGVEVNIWKSAMPSMLRLSSVLAVSAEDYRAS